MGKSEPSSFIISIHTLWQRLLRDRLLKRSLPAHLVNHLTTMADLHRAGRYDRMSDDVLTLTGQRPLRAQEFVRKHATKFDFVCEKGHGCAPIPFDDEKIAAIQKTDLRCNRK